MTRQYIKKDSAEHPVSKTEFQTIQKKINLVLKEVSTDIGRQVFITRFQLAKKLSEPVFKSEPKKPKLDKYVGASLYTNICFHLNIYLQSVSCELSMGVLIPRLEIFKEIQKIVMSSEKITEKIAKLIHDSFSKTVCDVGMSESIKLAEKFVKENEFAFSIIDGDLTLMLSDKEVMNWAKRQLKKPIE